MTSRKPPEAVSAAGHEARLEARLTGPCPRLDRRQHVVRGGIADIRLAGLVAAANYVEPLPMACRSARTCIRADGADGAVAVSELLFGEGFELFEIAGDWGFGRCSHDGYVGWVALAALEAAATSPDHMVSSRLAPVFSAADIKAPVTQELPFGSRLSGSESGAFVALSCGGFVHRRHVAPLPETPLQVARLFTGAPYLWGGRTPLGVDCSGLVQAALAACGTACPRDSDQQREQLGIGIDFADRRGGDLVFFVGHVGMLVDSDTLFHANAHWMAVVEEPLADVIGRGAAVIAIRRV